MPEKRDAPGKYQICLKTCFWEWPGQLAYRVLLLPLPLLLLPPLPLPSLLLLNVYAPFTDHCYLQAWMATLAIWLQYDNTSHPLHWQSHIRDFSQLLTLAHWKGQINGFSWLLMLRPYALVKLFSWLLPTHNAHILYVDKVRSWLLLTTNACTLVSSLSDLLHCYPLRENISAAQHLSISNMYKAYPCSQHHSPVPQNRPTDFATKLPLQAVTLKPSDSDSESSNSAK